MQSAQVLQGSDSIFCRHCAKLADAALDPHTRLSIEDSQDQASKRRPVCTREISGADTLLVPGRNLGAALCTGLALVAVVAAAVPVRVPAAHKSCSVHSHIMSHNAFPLCQDKHA